MKRAGRARRQPIQQRIHIARRAPRSRIHQRDDARHTWRCRRRPAKHFKHLLTAIAARIRQARQIPIVRRRAQRHIRHIAHRIRRHTRSCLPARLRDIRTRSPAGPRGHIHRLATRARRRLIPRTLRNVAHRRAIPTPVLRAPISPRRARIRKLRPTHARDITTCADVVDARTSASPAASSYPHRTPPHPSHHSTPSR